MPDIYGTLAQADAYFAARGNAAWAAATDEAKTAALVRASAFVDGMVGQAVPNTAACIYVFPGTKTAGYSQALQWPRNGARDRFGESIPDGEVPGPIQYAAYEGAVRELVTPNSLNPDFVPSAVVQREKVGPLEVEYAVAKNGNPSIRPTIGVIDSLLYPFLVVRCPGIGIAVA